MKPPAVEQTAAGGASRAYPHATGPNNPAVTFQRWQVDAPAGLPPYQSLNEAWTLGDLTAVRFGPPRTRPLGGPGGAAWPEGGLHLDRAAWNTFYAPCDWTDIARLGRRNVAPTTFTDGRGRPGRARRAKLLARRSCSS